MRPNDSELMNTDLHSIFFYREGKLFWKEKPKYSHIDITEEAGYLHKGSGYRRVKLNKKLYAVHRVIWAMHNETLPSILDHINRDTTNNNIENLRPATPRQSELNKNIWGSSKYKGVTWHKSAKRWQVVSGYRNEQVYLGIFIDEGDAAMVWNDWVGSEYSKDDLKFVTLNNYEEET